MRRLGFSVLLVLLPVLSVQSIGLPRTLMLDVKTAPLAWGDSRLGEKLETALSRIQDFRVRSGRYDLSDLPPFPENRTDTDSLLNWGKEAGGRYLLVVTVGDEYLERRKSFSLPLIFQRYQTVGVIRGEFRFLDLQKGRLLAAEQFDVQLVGTGRLQGATDDNRNDPDLHMAAPEKGRLFCLLEDKLTDQLVKRVSGLATGR